MKNFLIMPTNKTYEITSFEQMCNILNNENKFDLLISFCECFDYYTTYVEQYREEYPKMSEGVTNFELFKFSFNWTDDGENKISDFKFQNSSTGEYFKLKPKSDS